MTARFDDYREITARFSSIATGCGKGLHRIEKGETIGYAGKRGGTICGDCWARWRAENAEADAIEAGHLPTCW